jgi:hypothetical protein
MLCRNLGNIPVTPEMISHVVHPLGIAVSRAGRLLSTADPVLESQCGGKDAANDTEGSEGDIGDYLTPGVGASAKVEKGLDSLLVYQNQRRWMRTYRVHVDQRNTGKASNQRYELVEMIGAEPGDN